MKNNPQKGVGTQAALHIIILVVYRQGKIGRMK